MIWWMLAKGVYNQDLEEVLDVDLSKDPETLASELQGNTTDVDACTATCEGMADGWIEQLNGCGALTPALEPQLRAALIEVCVAGCDSNHPFGASTLPPGTTSSPSNYTSFAHAISSVLNIPESELSDPLNGNFDPLCNVLLIDMPAPYGHSYSQANENFPMLDTCACQKILDNELAFAGGSLPGGVTTEEELFTYTHDIELLNYEGTKCKCRDAYAEDFDLINDPYTQGKAFGEKGTSYLKELALPINAEIACGGCISCFTLVRYFEDHQALRAQADGDVMLATYINQQEGFNLTAADYLQHMETCEALIASCGRDAVTANIGEWLDELNTANQLSSPSYTFSYPRTEFEDIYTVPPGRCLNITYSSSLLYAREFDQSINYVAADGNGGVVAAGHASTGDVLVFKQAASGEIEWRTTIDLDLQLDQIRVAVASDGEVWLFGLTTGSQPELAVANLSSTGTLEWAQRIGHPLEIHRLTGIVEQPGTNAFVASFSYKHAAPEDWKLGSTLVQVIDGTFGTIGFSNHYDDLGGNVYAEHLTSPYFNQLAEGASDKFVFLSMNETAGHLMLTPFAANGTVVSADVEKFPEIQLYCSDNGYSISQMADGRYAILLRSKEEGVERWMTTVMAYNPSTKVIDWQHLFKFQNSTRRVDFQLESMSLEAQSDGGLLVSGLLSGAYTNFVANKNPAVFKIDAAGDLVWTQMREETGSSHMLAIEVESDEITMLADQELLFNRLVGKLNKGCSYRTFWATHTDEQLTEDYTAAIGSSGHNLTFPSTNPTSSTIKVNFTPICGEQLFINYVDDCNQTDCDMTLKLPAHTLNASFATLDDVQNGRPWGRKGFLVYGGMSNTNLPILGTWSCMADCGDDPLCNQPAFRELTIENEDCEALLNANATYAGQVAYTNYLKGEAQKFIEAYNAKCLGAGITETFDMEYEHWQYQYTLYYYDQAGSLVATVPPKGVEVDFTTNNPDHKMRTFYNYNSLGQLTEQNTPDGGYSQFWV